MRQTHLPITMDFKICKDIKECERLWNSFSPNQRLFDIWDFRQCFFDKKSHEPHFIVGYEENGAGGFLPLVLDINHNSYSYFGGWFTAERNKLYIKDKKNICLFLEKCPLKTLIEGLDPAEKAFYDFEDDEFTHYLDLAQFNHDFDTYLSSLDKKRQKNLRHELKAIPKYEVYTNRIKDCKRLVDLNIKGFGEDSKFNDPSITEGISRLAKLALKKGCLDMISLEINGKVEAVDICVYLNGTYSSLIGSSNYQKIPNIGKLMTMLDIRYAMEKKAKIIEFGATADHWKEMWRFKKDMLLKFSK